MPYLNWKSLPANDLEQDLKKVNGPDSPDSAWPAMEFLLQLSLNEARVAELLPYLEDIFNHQTELRIDLPQEWVIFFKTRESENRFLMAHPQAQEWVSMLAFESTHGLRLVEHLREKKAGSQFRFSEIGDLGSVSNLEVVLNIK